MKDEISNDTIIEACFLKTKQIFILQLKEKKRKSYNE